MNQSTFVKVAMVTFGLILLNFVILGITRSLVSFRVAQLVTAPITGLIVILVGLLLVVSVLAKLGIIELTDDA